MRVRGVRASRAGGGMKQSDVDALVARQARVARRFGMWLWALTPILGLVLYFGYFSPHHHPVVHRPAQPFSCASENARLSNIGAGGQIAPLCGDTPYPGGG